MKMSNIKISKKSISEGVRIDFPGGYFALVECTTKEIWAHIVLDQTTSVVGSRADAKSDTNFKDGNVIHSIEEEEIIGHVALKIKRGHK